MTSRYVFEREERSLFDILSRTANSLARCVSGEDREFALPSLWKHAANPNNVGRGRKA